MAAEWRAMGMWRNGREFLVVLGESDRDCRRRVSAAMADYSFDDLCRVEFLWTEYWQQEGPVGEWVPHKPISLRRLRYRRAQTSRSPRPARRKPTGEISALTERHGRDGLDHLGEAHAMETWLFFLSGVRCAVRWDERQRRYRARCGQRWLTPQPSRSLCEQFWPREVDASLHRRLRTKAL